MITKEFGQDCCSEHQFNHWTCQQSTVLDKHANAYFKPSHIYDNDLQILCNSSNLILIKEIMNG
jgi:hypothetical protein